jgi:hypothetical protein
MTIVCAWCSKLIDTVDDSYDVVSHGMCERCFAKFEKEEDTMDKMTKSIDEIKELIKRIDALVSSDREDLMMAAALAGDLEFMIYAAVATNYPVQGSARRNELLEEVIDLRVTDRFTDGLDRDMAYTTALGVPVFVMREDELEDELKQANSEDDYEDQ